MEPPKPRHSLALGKVLLIWMCFFAVPLFAAAGALFWWNAWAFLIVNLISIAFVNWVIYPNTPGLATERQKAGANTKKWDKILVPLLVALLPMISNITAGLDKRFGWTHSITLPENIIALALYIASASLIAYSMMVNRFFSSHYHIQKEREHAVVMSCPYSIIRHPGYLGMLLGSIALPVLLGSVPALGVGFVSAAVTILRTHLEDRALRVELPGYEQYAQKVPNKLVPLLW